MFDRSCRVDSTATTGTPIVTVAGGQKSPTITRSCPAVVQSLGPDHLGIVTAWQDERGVDADIFASRQFAHPSSGPWDTSPIAICSADGDQTDPVVVGDDHGGALFAWIDMRSGSREIYGQAVDDMGTAQWTPDGLPICSAPSGCESLVAAADGPGGAYLCWLDHRAGDAIYAERVTKYGIPDAGWQTGGNPVASGVALAGAIRLIADANGIAVAWTDTRDDAVGDVFVQRLGNFGALAEGWPTNGRALAAGAEAQRVDDLVSDGSGGCFVVWESGPAVPGNVDLFATRLAADGTTMPGWPTAVSANPARQDHARAAWAGDGLCVIFSDDRAGNRDIYVCRFEANGSVSDGWVPDGIRVCGAPGTQDSPIIEPAFMGGVLAAWHDERDFATNGVDLYAANISQGGAVDVPAAVAPRLVLGAPRPNPAHGDAAFSLDLTQSEWVAIDVLDCAGWNISALSSGRMGAGRHEVHWDERTDHGLRVAAGVYFVRAKIGEASLQRPVVVLR